MQSPAHCSRIDYAFLKPRPAVTPLPLTPRDREAPPITGAHYPTTNRNAGGRGFGRWSYWWMVKGISLRNDWRKPPRAFPPGASQSARNIPPRAGRSVARKSRARRLSARDCRCLLGVTPGGRGACVCVGLCFCVLLTSCSHDLPSFP
ncbi:hypothetical protein FKM82_016039 [Ascaphus truei]